MNSDNVRCKPDYHFHHSNPPKGKYYEVEDHPLDLGELSEAFREYLRTYWQSHLQYRKHRGGSKIQLSILTDNGIPLTKFFYGTLGQYQTKEEITEGEADQKPYSTPDITAWEDWTDYYEGKEELGSDRALEIINQLPNII